MISEVKFVTLGVADLERAARFYGQAFGYVELGRGPVQGAGLEKAWSMPSGLTGRFAVLGAPQQAASGLLRLVQFDAAGERIWGDYSRKQDLGHYAVNFRVRDIRAAWPRMLAAGAVPKCEPTFWTVNAQLSAWDSMTYDPDGIILDVFQVQGDLAANGLGEQTAEVSDVQTVAIHVADAPRSSAFYRGLGFEILYDKLIEDMPGFFGVPEGTRVRNVNFRMPGPSPNGRIEVVQYVGLDGRSVRDRAVPPNHGILSASFETGDLEAAARRFEELGALSLGASEASFPPFGAVGLRTFLGPDGEALEVFERRPPGR